MDAYIFRNGFMNDPGSIFGILAAAGLLPAVWEYPTAVAFCISRKHHGLKSVVARASHFSPFRSMPKKTNGPVFPIFRPGISKVFILRDPEILADMEALGIGDFREFGVRCPRPSARRDRNEASAGCISH
jgi:hypothetical protein